MRPRKEYKTLAHNALRGNWKPAVLTTLLFLAVTVVISCAEATPEANPDGLSAAYFGTVGVSTLLMWFVMVPMSVGFYNAIHEFYIGSKDDMISAMFRLGFGGGRYWHNLWGMILTSLKIVGWTCLLIVPGFIMSMAYAMTPFILVDKPELSANQASKLSRKMMKGHKWDLFVLYLSFIGWGILCILTLGIGGLWLEPYIYTTLAAYYEDLKAEYKEA